MEVQHREKYKERLAFAYLGRKKKHRKIRKKKKNTGKSGRKKKKCAKKISGKSGNFGQKVLGRFERP